MVSVPEEESKVYRNGQHSLFSVFTKCCRGATHESQDRQSPGQGDTLSKTRFNKLLEKDEFVKVRNRGQGADACDKNSENFVGSYVFINRRWRDPADPADCAALRVGYRELVTRYHGRGYVFLSEDVFLQHVWAASVDAERWRREKESQMSHCSQSSVSSAQSSSPQSFSASPSSSAALGTQSPASDGSKRKSPEQSDPGPARRTKQLPPNFAFRPRPDLEQSPSARSSARDSKVAVNISLMTAAKDSSSQKSMSSLAKAEAAALAAKTAEILEQEPLEMVKTLEFHQDFFDDLLPSNVDDRAWVVDMQDTDSSQLARRG
eukprot:273298-Rhodomonas_salina.1